MGAFDSLRHRDFRLFWLAAMASNVGTWMQTTALAWFVLDLTHSAFWVSFVTFASLVPTVLSPIGGVMTDRFDRRRILLVTQAIMLVLAAILAIVTWAGHASLVAILTITFASGLTFAVNGPTWLAFVPSLVPPEEMVNAIALNSMQFNAARVVGPAIGGLLIAAVGPGLVFAINAASYLAVVAAVAVIHHRSSVAVRGVSSEGMRTALTGGVAYAWRHRGIRTLITTTAVLSFCAGPLQTMLPIYAANVFHRGAGGFGLLGAALGVGSVLGALGLARLGNVVAVRTIAVAMATVSLFMVLFGTNIWFPSALVLVACYGGAYLFALAATNGRIQTEVEESMRGRVLSLYILAWVAFPIGSLVAGTVAEHLGVTVTTFGGAALLAVWAATLYIREAPGAAAGQAERLAA